MKKKKYQPTLPSPLQDNVLSLIAIVSLIALTLASVSGILWMLVRTGVLSYDPGMFDPQTTETAPHDHADGIFDILRPIADETPTDDMPEIIRFSGSFATLRALLSDLQIPDHYRAQFETVLYTGGEEVKTTVHFYRSGTSYRINRTQIGAPYSANPSDIYVSDGTTVAYTDNRSGKTVRFPISTSFSPEALAGIPSIASFNNVPDEQILHASYTELSGEIVYYVLYVTPTAEENRIVHELWISADTELVMRCNTYLCTAADEPTQVIADEDARLFSASLVNTAALTEKQRKNLFTLPQEPS